MDLIVIADLEVFYCVGVPDAERAHPQRLLLTLEIGHDFTQAATGDALGATIDYQAVSQRLLGLGQKRSWRLLERLAVEIADLILREFKAAEVAVTVKKFIIPQARHVAVCVRRGQPKASPKRG
jgi:dihydroneopterin aldolase